MTAPLRAAVVGVGAFGRHHARILSELAREDGNVRLVGLVDIDPAGPRDLARRLDVPLVERVGDLPEPVDLVTVAVPTHDHRVIAEPLLARGVHCLVEKPLAGSSTDAAALKLAAERGNAVLQVGLVERFNPVMKALERLGAPPAFVEVHRLAPYPHRGTDVGVVMDMMIHDLDLLNHVVGEEAERVEAVGLAVAGAYEDLANARITFPSGCVANVTSSRVSLQRMRRFRIFSAEGYLAMDYDRREAFLVVPPSGGIPAVEVGAGTGDSPLPPGYAIERIAIGDAEPLKEEIAALVAVIRSGARPRVGGDEGLRALRLAERILADLCVKPVPRS